EDERSRSSIDGRPVPRAIPLVTPAQLADLKARVSVRELPEVRRLVLLWGFAYLAAFQALSLVWRARGLQGDRVLLTIAHVLTAVGFAAMLSRPDALRDSLLF